MKIIKNPNEAEYLAITEEVNNNGGFCPCSLLKNDDTKCPCREFREQDDEGECHCGRYVKGKEVII